MALTPRLAHPFWDAYPDPGVRRAMQAGFALQVAGAAPVAAEARSEEAEEFVPRAEARGDPGSEVGWVESMGRPGPGAP